MDRRMERRRPERLRRRCRKHPEHLESTGVCPFCLTERLLSYLEATNDSDSDPSSVSTLCSTCSSDVSSAAASPRPVWDWSGKGSTSMRLSVLLGKSERVITKSRSLAFWGSRRRDGGMIKEEEEGLKERKKDGGFWKRLLGGGRRRRSEKDCHGSMLLHSKTVKEDPAKIKIVLDA